MECSSSDFIDALCQFFQIAFGIRAEVYVRDEETAAIKEKIDDHAQIDRACAE